MDWRTIFHASADGRLMEWLAKLPRERWTEQDGHGYTILHFACRGPNVAAVVSLVQSGLVDVNVPDRWGWTPTRLAASWMQARVLEVLCAAGADIRACSADDISPIDDALGNASHDSGACVRVLVANGVRLRTAYKAWRRHITPELVAFEHCVLRCRAAVVAMLRVKRAGELWRWDKFLLRELAIAIWATRYENG